MDTALHRKEFILPDSLDGDDLRLLVSYDVTGNAEGPPKPPKPIYIGYVTWTNI